MRQLLPTLFLFFSLSAFGQFKLKGTFCTEPYNDYCLTFRNDSLFDFSELSCTGERKGNGKYFLEQKSTKGYYVFLGTLTLNFTSADTLNVPAIPTIEDTLCNIADTVTLFFLITDKQTQYPVLFTVIWITGPQNDTIGISTGLDG